MQQIKPTAYEVASLLRKNKEAGKVDELNLYTIQGACAAYPAASDYSRDEMIQLVHMTSCIAMENA